MRLALGRASKGIPIKTQITGSWGVELNQNAATQLGPFSKGNLVSVIILRYDKIILKEAIVAAKAITVTLGKMAAHANRHLSSGRYASMSEVMRAGLRALDREEAVLDGLVHARVKEALADPRPAVPLKDAFAQVRAAVVKPPA
jgi:antitoxin ParD1/3/4